MPGFFAWLLTIILATCLVMLTWNIILLSLRLNKTAGRGEQVIKRQSNGGKGPASKAAPHHTISQQLRKYLHDKAYLNSLLLYTY